MKNLLIAIVGDRKREPVRAVRSVLTALSVVVYLLALWGVGVSQALQDRATGTIEVLVPILIVACEWIRTRVVSPASAAEAVAIAKDEPRASAQVPSIAVEGFRAMTAKELGRPESMIDWRPRVSPQ